MPYKFNCKELDEETSLYYYGARYMQPVASIWYGVDILTAQKVANKEVDGEINQIKVAAEIGFHYKGKQYDSLNEVIDQYSKDKTMNLRDIVVPSQEHIKTYESQGKALRRAHINRKKNKERTK